MKIVIPTDDRKGTEGTVALHFGRCSTYTFLDENGNVIEMVNNTSEHMGGKGLPPEIMKQHGANVLLCRDLGPRALMLCKEFKIDVFTCNAETVKEIFELWKNNEMKKAGNDDVCESHKGL